MRRLVWAAMGVALISMVFAGCKEEEEPTYTVKVTATEGGTVEGQNGEYKEGETVVFTAVPADGYFFSKWSDGNYYNPRTITIDTSNVTISAEFVDATLPIVDLGLKSGTLWATCNLGAENPWEYGDYYAWGETQTKDDYSFVTYKYCNGSAETLTKYCFDAEYGYEGFTDTLTTLESADDAATVVLGSNYSMPTVAEWEELGDQCYWVWAENYNNQNVSGYIVYKAKSANDKGTRVYADGTRSALYPQSASYSLTDAHIFLPAAGFRSPDEGIGIAGWEGGYWSASLHEDALDYARNCRFYSDHVSPSSNCGRCCGNSVRPVKRP